MPGPTQRVNPEQPTGVELTSALRAELLDPASWRMGLEKYALAMHLAVALTDADGHLLGGVINPRPTWSMFHARKPPSAGECPFSLLSPQPCTCVADALTKGGLALARDRTGLVHVAVPLLLGGQRLGALLAGQVFDQYPDQAVLGHLAGKLGLSPKQVWQKARLEQPVKRATLAVYGDLLTTLGSSFLQTRYHALVEANRVAELTRLRDLLQRQAQELTEADRHKDEFLATLAHELRNPLAPLRNGLQIMRLARGNAESVEQARIMMERQLGQMVRLIDDLLDVSRISRGKIELRKRRVELEAILQSALEISRPLIEQAGHDLTVSVPPEPIFVDADVTRLAQVLSNLLNNAAKYTDRGGHIWLTVERQGGNIAVSVKDAGIGIPVHMLPKVWEMFTQIDRSLEKVHGGLGVGLTIVRRLVEMHGGTVEARSEGRGMGSEFIVVLPIACSVLGGQPAEVEGEPVGPSARRRILVVDDNKDAAISLAMMLKMMGNDTQTAFDGLEALDVAAAFRPDVILLDIGMPKLNGYDTANRIRQQPWGKSVVLVALTGRGQEEDKRRSQEAGFNTHMVKPVEPAVLEKLLAGLQATTACWSKPSNNLLA